MKLLPARYEVVTAMADGEAGEVGVVYHPSRHRGLSAPPIRTSHLGFRAIQKVGTHSSQLARAASHASGKYRSKTRW